MNKLEDNYSLAMKSMMTRSLFDSSNLHETSFCFQNRWNRDL